MIRVYTSMTEAYREVQKDSKEALLAALQE